MSQPPPSPPPRQPHGPTDPRVLNAPWRDSYLQSLGEQEKAAASGAKPPASFLVGYWLSPERDEENHVVARVGEGDMAGMILLNRYPYANGHLLVALAEPRPTLLDYSRAQRAAFWRLVNLGALVLERSLAPQGINIGLNQGRAAGAGLPEHLHAHLVPRWHGDVNFFTVVGAVRVHPSALANVAARLCEAWARLRESGEIERA